MLAIIGIVIATILLVFGVGMAAFYSGSAEADGIGSDGAVCSVLGHAADGIEPPTFEDAVGQEEQTDASEVTPDAEGPAVVEEYKEEAVAQSAAGTGRLHGVSSDATPAKGSGGSSGSKGGQPASSNPAPQKKWVEDTLQIWIEDRAA